MEKSLMELVMRWIKKADNDLKASKSLLFSDEPITDASCFHAQQAVEKYLKAFLVHNNIMPDKTHKIENIIGRCSEIDSSFNEISFAVFLTEYAVELRYPDDFYIPDLDEAETAYATAINVREFIKSKIEYIY